MSSSLLINRFEDPGVGNTCIVGDNHWYVTKLADKVKQFVHERTVAGKKKLIIHVGDCAADKRARDDFDRFLPQEIKQNIRINLGNHDWWITPHDRISLWDFWMSDSRQIITIRGAKTPDQFSNTRHSRYSEELSPEQFDEITESIRWLSMTPRIIITHDAPSSVVRQILDNTFTPSITNEKLEELSWVLSELPQNPHGTYWVYGHHHVDNIQKNNWITYLGLGKLNRNGINEYRGGGVVL